VVAELVDADEGAAAEEAGDALGDAEVALVVLGVVTDGQRAPAGHDVGKDLGGGSVGVHLFQSGPAGVDGQLTGHGGVPGGGPLGGEGHVVVLIELHSGVHVAQPHVGHLQHAVLDPRGVGV